MYFCIAYSFIVEGTDITSIICTHVDLRLLGAEYLVIFPPKKIRPTDNGEGSYDAPTFGRTYSNVGPSVYVNIAFIILT